MLLEPAPRPLPVLPPNKPVCVKRRVGGLDIDVTIGHVVASREVRLFHNLSARGSDRGFLYDAIHLSGERSNGFFTPAAAARWLQLIGSRGVA